LGIFQEEKFDGKMRKVELKNDPKPERASPMDFLFRESNTKKSNDVIKRDHSPSPKPNKIQIHPYQEDHIHEPGDNGEERKNSSPIVPYDDFSEHSQPEASHPPDHAKTYHQRFLTHPAELTIRPEELDFHVAPYEPRPFAQHFIVPVQGIF